jgi:putative endopeptidase
VKPGDDFYRYANGKWDAAPRSPRTARATATSTSSRSSPRTGCTPSSRTPAGKLNDADAAKVAAAYASYMDEALAERLDAKPIAPELAQIKALKTKDEMTALMGKANTTGFATILPVYVTIDAKAPTRYTVGSGTGGLGLPDRDYYLQPQFATQKAKYEAYIAQLLTMVGWDKPAERAKAVVAFETRLAQDSWTRAERRNRDKTYNPMTPAELQAATPGFDWNRYLVGTGLPKLSKIVVTTNTSFPKYAKIYSETDLDTLKAWQAFHVADGLRPTSPSASSTRPSSSAPRR